jgi:pimeloyl-ACP methyl ester carboxylesterase
MGPMMFAFLHGAYHGAWCWQRVLGALDQLGYRGVAIDLPCSDGTAAGREYAAAAVAALAGEPGPVIVVAHSMSGLIAPLVAAARPVARLVFVGAVLPAPGLSFAEQRHCEPDILLSGGTDDVAGPRQDGMLPGPPADGRWARRWYNTCTDQDTAWAMSQLRPQGSGPFEEVTPLERWPDVPSSYLICTQDRACNPVWSERAARDRLGVQPQYIRGSGHSPFIDRPGELARILADLAIMKTTV